MDDPFPASTTAAKFGEICFALFTSYFESIDKRERKLFLLPKRTSLSQNAYADQGKGTKKSKMAPQCL